MSLPSLSSVKHVALYLPLSPGHKSERIQLTQQPDDLPDLERIFSSSSTLAPECNSFKWNVQLIDTEGNIEGKMVATRDVWKLQNRKVIVHFDGDSGQPIEDSGGVLGSWLGQLSNDVNLLLINYSDWRLVSTHIKDKAWDVIQARFWFDDPTTRKKYVLSLLGNRCKDIKRKIWKEYKQNGRTETVQNRPKNVPEDQWHHLVNIRFAEKWKKIQARNVNSQQNNNTPHVCGRKSFARRRNEIKIKTGKTPSRAEFFIATRTKSDGSFVSEEAKTRVESLTMLLNRNPSTQVTNNVTAALDDEYAQVFGPERPGRVRCVGRGPTPSKFLRRSTIISREVETSEVIQLRTDMQVLNDKVKSMSSFIQQILGSSTGEYGMGDSFNRNQNALANISVPTNSEVNSFIWNFHSHQIFISYAYFCSSFFVHGLGDGFNRNQNTFGTVSVTTNSQEMGDGFNKGNQSV